MTFNVLVAEPGDETWSIIADGLRQYWPDASILRVKDGEQAVRFLFYRGLFSEAPETPDLVVLARDLPTVATEAVVARLRQHPRTSSLPVVVVGRGRQNTDLAKTFERDQEQLIVVVGADDLQSEVAEAVQQLCDEPPAIVSVFELESRLAGKAI